MGNLEDDFTPEEKELLKREMKHRIQQQRIRETSGIRSLITMGVIGALTVLYINSRSPALTAPVGGLFVVVMLIMAALAVFKPKP